MSKIKYLTICAALIISSSAVAGISLQSHGEAGQLTEAVKMEKNQTNEFPEFGTIALLAMGVAGLGVARRQQK